MAYHGRGTLHAKARLPILTARQLSTSAAQMALGCPASVSFRLGGRAELPRAPDHVSGVLVPGAGIALMKHTAWRTLERGGQFVLLGSAPDPKVQVRPLSRAAAVGMKLITSTAISLLVATTVGDATLGGGTRRASNTSIACGTKAFAVLPRRLATAKTQLSGAA